MKLSRRIGLLMLASVVGVGALAGRSLLAAEPKYSIEDVMKKIHKPKTGNVYSRVVVGKGTADDKKLIVEYYEALAASKAPKGDAKDWEKRTGAMFTAAKAVVDGGDAKSLAALKTATNCKECHDLFKD